VRTDRRSSQKSDKKTPARGQRQGIVGFSKKSALLEEAINHMNTGKYGRSSTALKELLSLDPQNMEARRLFATLHLKLGSLVTARQAFESLANEAIGRQDYWLAESLLREYLAAGPRCVPFLELLAHVYQAKGDEMAAVGELGKAIEILRDDPDPEHQQKAAQFYAKIRELAPVSPVALELAPLFDVRTGEFLANRHDHASVTTVPAELLAESTSGSVLSETTQGLPDERMATEILKETVLPADTSQISGAGVTTGGDASTQTPVSPSLEASPTNCSREEGSQQTFPLDAPEAKSNETRESQDPLLQQGGLLTSLHHQVNESNIEAPSLTGESIEACRIDSPATQGPSQEIESNDGAGGSSATAGMLARDSFSPMPWDQEADASVQIPAPQPPTQSRDPLADLEAILASLGTETTSPVQDTSDQSVLMQEEAIEAGPETASDALDVSKNGLPSPMPWEEMADATVQIEEAQSAVESIPVQSSDTSLSTDADETKTFSCSNSSARLQGDDDVQSQGETLAIPVNQESMTEADPVSEPSPVSSFSWNSIFDTAWKVAAGVVSPGEPATTEKAVEGSSETHEVQAAEVEKTQPVEQINAPETLATETIEIAEGEAFSDLGTDAEASAEDKSTISLGQDSEIVAAHSDELSSADLSMADSGPPIRLSFDTAVTEETNSESVPSEVEKESEVAHPPEESSPCSIPASLSGVVEKRDLPVVETDSAKVASSSESIELTSSEPPPPVPLSEFVLLNESVSSDGTSQSPASEPNNQLSAADQSSHWDTGEVAVQLHRPTQKKKRWQIIQEQEPQDAEAIPSEFEATAEPVSQKTAESVDTTEEALPHPTIEEVVPPPDDPRPEWMQASDTITFAKPAIAAPPREESFPVEPYSQMPESASLSVESAVDVLFPSASTESGTHARTQQGRVRSKPSPDVAAYLHRARIAVSSFIGSCFSTTRSVTVLGVAVLVTGVVSASLIFGVLGLTWMAMEEPPSTRYQNLTISPPRTITDMKKNGYLLLLGFDAPIGQDPIEAGFQKKVGESEDAFIRSCLDGDDPRGVPSSTGASGHVVKGWFRNSNPIAHIKGQSASVKSLAEGEAVSLTRYRQWLSMPFDDWGYGQQKSPNCSHVLLAHRLFLAEGISEGPAAGLARLESDIQAWRTALGQSKTLPMKMLAVTALQDDAMLASDLLSHSELEDTVLTRLSKVVRPLDQVELSLRWPMQSQFVWATENVSAELKHDSSHERPWYVSMVAAMKLPIQRRANAYAEYYEDSNKAFAEGRFTNLPNLSDYLRTPATGIGDYVANPIEHVVGIEPLPAWDPYVLRIVETDARLRLVGLQAWLRRGLQDGDVLTRLAKAGQAYYDPFTGLPMLVNQRIGLIYSVGSDGKDQEGDLVLDIAATIPSVEAN